MIASVIKRMFGLEPKSREFRIIYIEGSGYLPQTKGWFKWVLIGKSGEITMFTAKDVIGHTFPFHSTEKSAGETINLCTRLEKINVIWTSKGNTP